MLRIPTYGQDKKLNPKFFEEIKCLKLN